MCCLDDAISIEILRCGICGHKLTDELNLEELKRSLVVVQNLIEKVETSVNKRGD